MRRAVTRLMGSKCFVSVKEGPADPILGLSVDFKLDKHPDKVNLAVGVYRGDDGKPFVLECVKRAQKLTADCDHEYAPISGVPGFVAAAQKLALTDDESIARRTASVQTLSGTGALRVAGDFLSRYGVKKIAVPNLTWANHMSIFSDSGMEITRYAYYDPREIAIDFEAMLESLKKLPEGTAVLLHACAHNPTGFDLTKEQMDELASVINRFALLPVVDMAYQGFASGDVDRDAYLPRLLTRVCPELVLCQSFAKSFGLYGERCGAAHFFCRDSVTARAVESQLKILIRPMYSNPPLFGARIVEKILNDAELNALWRTELTGMADRMNGIRKTLVDELNSFDSKKDWSHITKQIGMMALTGINMYQVKLLREDYHIYLTGDGRAAISGLNSSNVEYFAKALYTVTLPCTRHR